MKKAYTKKAVVNINYVITTPMGQEAICVNVTNDGNVDMKINALGMTDKKSGKNAFIPTNADVLKESVLPKKLSTGDDVKQAIAIQPLLESIETVMDLSCIYGFADLSTGERIYSESPIDISSCLNK
ncbi:hypothetical protein FD45_GL000080 [Liquorilactobacillus nagelii DSM 13675]|nr:hypothetical protein FD45_GL000080 [Liquorilactobacillus nagelii DSM 13675]